MPRNSLSLIPEKVSDSFSMASAIGSMRLIWRELYVPKIFVNKPIGKDDAVGAPPFTTDNMTFYSNKNIIQQKTYNYYKKM